MLEDLSDNFEGQISTCVEVDLHGWKDALDENFLLDHHDLADHPQKSTHLG